MVGTFVLVYLMMNMTVFTMTHEIFGDFEEYDEFDV